ncbi:hypothetical protein ODJ79_19885 [Actinoplanes sp. KI2]|uniref:hypothetical protein n=1 Tax=Actinoplanes sp. KI2 TaxID=2983315 RepID=UPI0021D5A4FF|nr:hypothetical protein [Actinoplanes sp. KI2]MCU7725991.1 hypothetical protein [Actinoplanes sp. KI2]
MTRVNLPRSKYLTPHTIGSYLAGCLSFAIGAYLFIHADLGTDPLDTFALGVLRHVHLTVGILQTLVAIVCLLIVGVWTRRRPPLSPILTFFLCGTIIDIERRVDWMRGSGLPPALLLVLATLLCAYGSALIIMSGFGIRSIDLVAITAKRRLDLPFWIGKGVIELTLLGLGVLLGGPAGIGTIAFLAGVDLMIQPLIATNGRVFRIPNHGLPALSSPARSRSGG